MSLLQDTINRIQPLDDDAVARAKERLDQLTMPHWALGRLMDLGMQLAGITGSVKPEVGRRVVVVMAGDHGVTDESVSKYPKEVTYQMVANFVNGGAGINAVSRVVGAGVLVVDMGVAGDLAGFYEQGAVIDKKVAGGTRNIAREPAMSRDEAIRAVEAGIEVAFSLKDTVDLLGTGDMGIGNTTPSSAIIAAITGRSPAEVTGRGTGLDDNQFGLKVRIIEKILHINQPDSGDALDVLAKVGGFEIGGIAGLILGSAAMRKPVLVDGLISTAGALIAQGLNPMACHYMIPAHRSVEQGHQAALDHLGMRPLLDLDMRLGEGTGAALAMNLVEAAVRVLTDVATFQEASVSQSEG